MTPNEAVSTLADVLDRLPVVTESAAYQQMHQAGVPHRDADCAYKFTQIACGRLLLQGIVSRFDDQYFLVNAAGEPVETGRIQEQPFFAAAVTLLRTRKCRWAGTLGAMSADVAAANDLLKRGSKPGGLQTGPAVLFLEAPTADGMERADRLITLQLSQASRPRRPWWQFWRRSSN